MLLDILYIMVNYKERIKKKTKKKTDMITSVCITLCGIFSVHNLLAKIAISSASISELFPKCFEQIIVFQMSASTCVGSPEP